MRARDNMGGEMVTGAYEKIRTEIYISAAKAFKYELAYLQTKVNGLQQEIIEARKTISEQKEIIKELTAGALSIPDSSGGELSIEERP